MHNAIDFSSWQSVLSTLIGLAIFSLVVVGIRLLVMQTVQMRRERENRQINERLRTLIAAYKALGGSFTGNLSVDPAHLRDMRVSEESSGEGTGADDGAEIPATLESTASSARSPGSDRRRRVRDIVEAALSDVILLGTEEQVKLAAKAASDMVAGRAVETAELVVSLRTFIREVLNLDPVPADVSIPKQGPTRPGASGSRGNRDERREAGGKGRGGGGGGGGGAGAGIGVGGLGLAAGDDHETG